MAIDYAPGHADAFARGEFRLWRNGWTLDGKLTRKEWLWYAEAKVRGYLVVPGTMKRSNLTLVWWEYCDETGQPWVKVEVTQKRAYVSYDLFGRVSRKLSEEGRLAIVALGRRWGNNVRLNHFGSNRAYVNSDSGQVMIPAGEVGAVVPELRLLLDMYSEVREGRIRQ